MHALAPVAFLLNFKNKVQPEPYSNRCQPQVQPIKTVYVSAAYLLSSNYERYQPLFRATYSWKVSSSVFT